MKVISFLLVIMLLCCISVVGTANAETTFTYQGQLGSAAQPSEGNHDFKFKLYDAQGRGAQVGNELTFASVAVTDGVFTVQLDFGATPFDSSPRWLEISVRETGLGTYTTLSPRQRVGAAPLAIRTLSVVPGAIDTAAIEDGAVTTTKIANDAIGTAQIENNTVSSGDIRDGTISQTDVAGGFLLTSKSQVYLVEGDTVDVVPGAVVEPSAACADANDIPLAFFCDVVTSLHLVTVRESFQLNWVSNSLPSEARCSMKNNAINLVAEVRVELTCIAVP